MSERTRVKLIVTDRDNISQAGFVLEFPTAQLLDMFVEDLLDHISSYGATAQCELNTCNYTIGGVSIEKTKR